MQEVCSLPEQPRDWLRASLICLGIAAALASFYTADVYWLAIMLSLFFGWWFVTGNCRWRMLGFVIGICAGLTVSCFLDSMTFTKTISQRGLDDIVWPKVFRYFIAGLTGACIGLLKNPK